MGILAAAMATRGRIREYGSGRTGMSNVLRTGGGKVAALVLMLDVSKGVLAVILAREVIGHREAEVAAGLLALAGTTGQCFSDFVAAGALPPGQERYHSFHPLRLLSLRRFCGDYSGQPLRFAGFHRGGHRSLYQLGGVVPAGSDVQHLRHSLRGLGRRHHHLAAPGQYPTNPRRHRTPLGNSGDKG